MESFREDGDAHDQSNVGLLRLAHEVSWQSPVC
jgi:hypothetical protein